METRSTSVTIHERGGSSGEHFLLEVQNDVAELLLDVMGNLMLSWGGGGGGFGAVAHQIKIFMAYMIIHIKHTYTLSSDTAKGRKDNLAERDV